MHRNVRQRVSDYAKKHGWASTYAGRYTYKKYGYEVYFFNQNDGFELTIRNPETRERETMLEVRDEDVCTKSPEYIATIKYVLKYAENIASKEL